MTFEGGVRNLSDLDAADLSPGDIPPGAGLGFMIASHEEMNSRYEDTSEGGLAVSVTLC